MLEVPEDPVAGVDAAGVWLDTGGVVWVPVVAVPAAVDSPVAEPLVLALGLVDPELLQVSAILVTELAFSMF